MRNADESDDSNADDGNGRADEGWAAGLEVLLDLIASVIEDTHEGGTAAVAPDPDVQLRRIAALRQAGNDLTVLASCGQPLHHPKENAHLNPTLPAIAQCLRGTIVLRRIPPSQTVAVDEDDPAQHAAVINPWPAVALGKEWLQAPSARPSVKTGR